MWCCLQVDPVVDAAAKASGLDIVEIKSYLPAGLTIWIDPREVSCRLTENGPVQVIYRGGSGLASDPTRRGADGDAADRELQHVNWGYDSFTAGARIPQNLSPSPGWSPTAGSSGASPVTGGNTRGLHPPVVTTTCFTAATFAQTKFGSTKMKSQGPQRPSRLSPIEPLPNGFPARLSPSTAPISTCWGITGTGGMSPTVNRLSPMHQNAPAQLGMMFPAGPGDARLAGLQEWIVLQHRHQLQMQYLTALKQQQQQGMVTSPLMPSLTNPRLASPRHYDAPVRQHLQLPQLQPPAPAHSLVTSPDVALFAPLARDSSVASGVNPALNDLSSADCIDWAGLDMAVPGYATGLQQLLLAN